MKKLLMMTALTLCIAVPAAMADTTTKHDGKVMSKEMMDKKADMWFSKIDTDGNGMISKKEHDAFGNNMFTEADTDKDGNISMTEMKAVKMKEHAEMKKDMMKKPM